MLKLLMTLGLLLSTAYFYLMGRYAKGWRMQPLFKVQPGFQGKTRVSIIVPARNEAANIAACVQSILSQEYPAAFLEIIMVDDHSEDDTAAIAKAAGGDRVRIISLKDFTGGSTTNAFKKKALASGIANSSGELIITVDADCIVPPGWLQHTVAMYEAHDAAMIIGPVAFAHGKGLLQVFQAIDFMTMQGITAATRVYKLGSMANGANLAFSRAAYDAVDGYNGTEQLASGDDYLLLHKMEQQFSDRIFYLKSPEAIVTTIPPQTWNAFLNQRIRWASKSGKYGDRNLTLILGLVYVFNVAILAAMAGGFYDNRIWAIAAAMLLLKTNTELLLLIPVARFFKRQRLLWYFAPLQPLHLCYIALAGFLGMKGGYRWKGRKVK